MDHLDLVFRIKAGGRVAPRYQSAAVIADVVLVRQVLGIEPEAQQGTSGQQPADGVGLESHGNGEKDPRARNALLTQ
jgi:hypothetical protein